ncbi:NAD(P)H:quinone oxidoreductase [Natronospirillum operosum]|uniref:NAD(P)H:quinone oxidoreductase n=1 Tax=Natronospirillum operosum TaxID=2759953 RepID=A0A4Z0WC63_9GAMM|nr:NAD(P)H:quinone oxidoreductase [Natronospirillum operosum]TGG95404.1 NAD(P)H:quinone oxidoreductase [Natronospirillum operosum]
MSSDVVTEPHILVLFYSRGGKTAELAETIADGILSVGGIDARLRTVPPLDGDAPAGDYLYCEPTDLASAAGLAMGSPTRFGTMAAPLKHWWEQTTPQWLNGDLVDKPACVFTSTSTLHGGQEATLLSMMLPLLHHGLVIAGTPYTEAELHTTESGGSPYGPTHWDKDRRPLSRDEMRLARAQGKRLARLALALANDRNGAPA